MAVYTLHHCARELATQQGTDTFVLQIGTMDGCSLDPVHPFITQYNWRGLMVEPIPHMYAKLCQTYGSHPQIRTEQAAITTHSGHATMHYVPQAAIDADQVPKWAAGASSLYTDRNALEFDTIRPLRQQCEVPALTLKALLTKHQVERIDLLVIDAEGHDYHILRQLDFCRFRPRVIQLEVVNLPQAEVQATQALLEAHDYHPHKAGYDWLCIDQKWGISPAR